MHVMSPKLLFEASRAVVLVSLAADSCSSAACVWRVFASVLIMDIFSAGAELFLSCVFLFTARSDIMISTTSIPLISFYAFPVFCPYFSAVFVALNEKSI